MSLLEIQFDLSAIDNSAGALCLVGYGVVFFVLALMVSIYLLLPKILSIKTSKMVKLTNGLTGKNNVNKNITGELNAAISMALHLHMTEMHDFESNIVTIKKVDKKYSPWSSKIHSLNPYFKKF